MTKFDGHPFFHRVLTIGLVSLLGGGLGVLGVTSVYHLNEKNSKNLSKQPINSKETVSSRSESPNTEDEFNSQSTIESQVSENTTSSNEINQNQLTNTQTSTTGPQRNSVTIKLRDGRRYTVTRDNIECGIEYKKSRQYNVDGIDNHKYGPSFDVGCISNGVITDLTGKETHFSDTPRNLLSVMGDKILCYSSPSSRLGITKEGRIYRKKVISFEMTYVSCGIGYEFGLIPSLKKKGYEWVSRQDDPNLDYPVEDHPYH